MALLGITRIFQPVSSWASRSFSRASKIKDKPKANKSEKVFPKGSKAKRRKFFGWLFDNKEKEVKTPILQAEKKVEKAEKEHKPLKYEYQESRFFFKRKKFSEDKKVDDAMNLSYKESLKRTHRINELRKRISVAFFSYLEDRKNRILNNIPLKDFFDEDDKKSKDNSSGLGGAYFSRNKDKKPKPTKPRRPSLRDRLRAKIKDSIRKFLRNHRTLRKTVVNTRLASRFFRQRIANPIRNTITRTTNFISDPWGIKTKTKNYFNQKIDKTKNYFNQKKQNLKAKIKNIPNNLANRANKHAEKFNKPQVDTPKSKFSFKNILKFGKNIIAPEGSIFNPKSMGDSSLSNNKDYKRILKEYKAGKIDLKKIKPIDISKPSSNVPDTKPSDIDKPKTDVSTKNAINTKDLGEVGEDLEKAKKIELDAENEFNRKENEAKLQEQKLKDAEENLRKARKNAKWYQKVALYAEEKAIATLRHSMSVYNWLSDKAARAKAIFDKGISLTKSFTDKISKVKSEAPKLIGEFFSKISKAGLNAAKPILKRIPLIGQIFLAVLTILDLSKARSNIEVRNILGRGIGGIVGALIGGLGMALGPIVGFITTMLVAFIGEWIGTQLSYFGVRPIDFIPFEKYDSPVEEKIGILKEGLETNPVPSLFYNKEIFDEALQQGKHLENPGLGIESKIANLANTAVQSVTNFSFSNYKDEFKGNPNSTAIMNSLVDCMNRAGLSDKEKRALYALALTETGGGKSLSENTNWSWNRACQLWPLGITPKGKALQACGKERWETLTPDQKADVIYFKEGGAKWKGRGLIQLTGEGNYTNLQKDLNAWGIGADVLSNPSLVASDPRVAAASAVSWWTRQKGIKEMAEKGDVYGIRARCAGGLDRSGGLQKFISFYGQISPDDYSKVKETSSNEENTSGSVNASNVSYSISSSQGDESVVKAAGIARSRAHSRSTGYCARYVKTALNQAGFPYLSGHAYQLHRNGELKKAGFKLIQEGTQGYSAQVGDVVVIDAFGRHKYGHVAIFDGSAWISDFLQRGINIYKDLTSDRLLKLYRFEGNLDPDSEETTGAKNAKGSDVAQSSQTITKNTNNKETVIIIVPPEDKKPEEMI